ncbi:MAG: hypothetical protein HKN12_09785 [Gemmatimonadetes bacterium]|nr:hypothetical protein [Gemmatimonadota bacterium]
MAGNTPHPPRMRPEFDIPVPGDGRDVVARLRELLAGPDPEFHGQARGDFAFVRHHEEQRSLLSPHLNLELRKADTGTVLHGRFSPRPNVWTGFMALFFVLAMGGLAGLVYGAAQWIVGGPVWTMWSAPVSVALIAFVYGAAFIGQGLSADQMFELRSFVEGVVREVPSEPAGRPSESAY